MAVGKSAESAPTRASMLFRLSVAGLRYLGVDVDAALERIGMTQADLEKLPARVPASLGIRYWNAIEEVTGRTDLGLALAELTRPEMFDVTGYVVRHSPTLGDAIRRLTRFGRLVGEGLDVVLEVQGDRAVIRQPSIPGHVDHPQLTQCFLATLGRLARQLTGESLRAIEVHMVHDAPPNAEQLAALFEAPIHYNAPFNGFVVEASMLQAPMLGHDARLGAILERQAEQLLEQLPERGGFVRRVQELLTEELNGGNPNADHIAARLDLSTRTLSRRLKAAATSHQTLLDQLRHELATRYLRNTELDVSEIAFVLGFSDASALNRAFKRWAGMTPTEYRRGVASG